MLTRLSWLCPIPVIKCSHSKHTYSYIDQDWRLLLLLKIIFATSCWKYAGKIQRNTVEISKKSDHWNMLDKFGEILLKNPKKCYWLLEQIQLKFGDVALLFLPLCCTRGQVLRYDCDNLWLITMSVAMIHFFPAAQRSTFKQTLPSLWLLMDLFPCPALIKISSARDQVCLSNCPTMMGKF